MRNKLTQQLTIAGLLIAVGIIIPMFSPFKILLEPASFTLASHVAIFIAMFLSPAMAAAVALGTTIGFAFGGFPLVVVLRAASQLVFAWLGAWYLKNHKNACSSTGKRLVFSFVIGLIHAFFELVVVSLFYFAGNMTHLYYDQGFVQSVLLLVGVGTVLHSMVDFEIAHIILKPLKKQKSIKAIMIEGE